jgi:KaiC/GvpD/RAD55 family RecA-like ATPase
MLGSVKRGTHFNTADYVKRSIMSIPISISGLNQFIYAIPDGTVVLLEGDIYPIKTVFAIQIGYHAHQQGKQVVYITSRKKECIINQVNRYYNNQPFSVLEENSYQQWKKHLKENTVLIVDSFSYLTLDMNVTDFNSILKDIHVKVSETAATVLLVIDREMIGGKGGAIASHLADGIIRFVTTNASTGVTRFIQIPKWMNGRSFANNIYYTFDDDKINVDLRSRVV